MGHSDGNPNRLEFFLFEKQTKERRDEILQEIVDAGGKEKCDIYYDGGYDCFDYRNCNHLINRLNDLNKVYNT